METERILLRPWREEDAEELYRLASDPEVGPRAGWSPHQSVDESREVIRTIFSNDHTWAIRLGRRQPACGNPSSQIVGCICYYPHGESNIGIGPDDAEVGYWVARPWWNRGLATEALRLLINHCFCNIGFRTLWGDYLESNPASGRVMQKCGFRPTGRVNHLSRLQFAGDQPVKVMRLDRPCWIQTRNPQKRVPVATRKNALVTH